MYGKEKAINLVKERGKAAVNEYRERIETLRKDTAFDSLFSSRNSLKWDYLNAKTEQARTDVENKIAANEAALKEYIAEKGLPKNILSVDYYCKLCNDTGFVGDNECACVEKARIEIELSENPLLKTAPNGLSDIDYSAYGKDADSKKKFAGILLENLSKSEKSYYLLAGRPGTAKTYFASVCVKNALLNGKSVRAMTAVKLNKLFLEYHCAALSKKSELWRGFSEPDMFLIDDLGAEQVLNNVTVPYLQEFLIDRMENKTTFITTNLSPTDLEKRYGQRILSRMLDKVRSVPIYFGGRDLRID
jgi:DNA replication protein DnaC